MTDGAIEDSQADGRPGRMGLALGGLFVGLWCVLWLADGGSGSRSLMLARTVAEVCIVSIVIWQVCDPFADAAQWVGEKLHLPGSIRGATLDAVASSMPELFAGLFFVILAVADAAQQHPGNAAAADILREAGAAGFGATIATCAGSAVYNMILIPAFCALVISFRRPSRPTIDIEDEVVSRDGLWFLMCQILLIWFLFEEQMMWWNGVVLIAVYAAYIGLLYTDARHHRVKKAVLKDHLSERSGEPRVREVILAMKQQGLRVSAAFVMKVQDELRADGAGTDQPHQTAGIFFGRFQVPLNGRSVVIILTVCMFLAAAACWRLVEATRQTAAILDVPDFFVAVILAAAASSVPDTLLAVGAARRGDDSGAVSNAFGSNIFDICICLSIPLLVNSWLTGWQPVSLLQNGAPMPGLAGLRVLLASLTVVNLIIMWHRRQITRMKAVFMCGLYVVFVGYAVLGAMGFSG